MPISHLSHFACAAALCLICACTPTDTSTLPVVAVSNAPSAHLVSTIAGEHAALISLTPSGGGCIHEYQPDDAQLVQLSRAQLWLTSGLPFEQAPWARALQSELTVVSLSPKPQQSSCGHTHDGPCNHHHNTHSEQHPWLNLQRYAAQATLAHQALCDLAPSQRETFDTNHSALQTHLIASHQALLTRLAPLKGSTFVVDHAAWDAFAKAYGMTQIALLDEHESTTDAQLSTSIQNAKDKGARILVCQTEASRARLSALATEAKLDIIVISANAADPVKSTSKLADALIAAHANPTP